MLLIYRFKRRVSTCSIPNLVLPQNVPTSILLRQEMNLQRPLLQNNFREGYVVLAEFLDCVVVGLLNDIRKNVRLLEAVEV